MSDIEPVRPPAGWYPDPTGRQRWWDGQQWGVYAPTTAYAEPPAPVSVNPLVVQMRPVKDVGVAYLLAILLGGLGAHRFYLGRIGSASALLIMYGVGWLLSLTLVGALLGVPLLIAVVVWLIVDLFLLPAMVRAANAVGGR